MKNEDVAFLNLAANLVAEDLVQKDNERQRGRYGTNSLFGEQKAHWSARIIVSLYWVCHNLDLVCSFPQTEELQLHIKSDKDLGFWVESTLTVNKNETKDLLHLQENSKWDMHESAWVNLEPHLCDAITDLENSLVYLREDLDLADDIVVKPFSREASAEQPPHYRKIWHDVYGDGYSVILEKAFMESRLLNNQPLAKVKKI